MFSFKILPQEDRFCALMQQLAREASSCAHHLRDYVQNNNPGQAAQALRGARNNAKNLTAEITVELCRSFVTPFDREDIQDFAGDLYKIPKTIEKVHERLELHGMTGMKGDFLRQIELIVEEAQAMEDMVGALISGKQKNKVQDKVRILYDLEARGDAVLGELLAGLFSENREPRELILRKDIYDMLEKVIDRYRDAAGVALQIVLKHG